MHFIAITGLSCSGKTTLSVKLQRQLGDNCLLISMDNYYKQLTPEQYEILHNDSADINFDTPDMIDFERLKSDLRRIRDGKETQLPKFDIGTCLISDGPIVMPNKYEHIILEGLFTLCDDELARLFDLKIWVETSDYVCALRRFMKFTVQIKGYTADYIYNQCIKYVIPGQEKWIKPFKSQCDLFVNGENGSLENLNVQLIREFIRSNKCGSN